MLFQTVSYLLLLPKILLMGRGGWPPPTPPNTLMGAEGFGSLTHTNSRGVSDPPTSNVLVKAAMLGVGVGSWSMHLLDSESSPGSGSQTILNMGSPSEDIEGRNSSLVSHSGVRMIWTLFTVLDIFSISSVQNCCSLSLS